MSRADTLVRPADDARVERTEAAPEAPPLRRRLRFSLLQRIAIPILAVLPALALAGVFDEDPIVVERTVGSLAMRAEIPQRIRQNRTAVVHVDLENRGSEPVSAVVALSPEYLEESIAIEMTPHPHRAWASRFDRIEPGARARVSLQYEGESAGMHEGVLRVVDGAGHEARVRVRTFVFP